MRPPSALALHASNELYVRQQRELGELLGFETRNKYAISTPDRMEVAFAAEQQKGILGFLLRQFLGHWRTFEIHTASSRPVEWEIARTGPASPTDSISRGRPGGSAAMRYRRLLNTSPDATMISRPS